VLGRVRRRRGRVIYHSTHGEFALERKSWAFFYPRFAIALAEVRGCELDIEFLSSRMELPSDLPCLPSIFEPAETLDFPSNPEGAWDFIRDGKNFVPVPYCLQPKVTSSRAKKRIDRGFQENDFTIGQLCKELRISNPLLSRYFKRDYGITPIQYRNHLRAISALELLMRGWPVTDAAYDVGFGDVGRFHRAFKRTTDLTPARYSPARARAPS
jgi:AraC-like DNA-binding protein